MYHISFQVAISLDCRHLTAECYKSKLVNELSTIPAKAGNMARWEETWEAGALGSACVAQPSSLNWPGLCSFICHTIKLDLMNSKIQF